VAGANEVGQAVVAASVLAAQKKTPASETLRDERSISANLSLPSLEKTPGGSFFFPPLAIDLPVRLSLLVTNFTGSGEETGPQPDKPR